MLSFSDDRRLFRPTLQQLAAASLETDVLAQSVGEVVHSVKQDLTLQVVLNGAVVQVEVYVPGFMQKTSSSPPILVGVPILHDLGSGMSSALSSPLRTLKHLKSVLRTPTVRLFLA